MTDAEFNAVLVTERILCRDLIRFVYQLQDQQITEKRSAEQVLDMLLLHLRTTPLGMLMQLVEKELLSDAAAA
jgi:hypothetical protein